jgi:hypothetical protein
MNEPDSIKPCPNYPLCAGLFARIDEKLVLVHETVIEVRDENIRLSAKISNGITSDLAIIKERVDSHRVLIYSLWGLIGGIVTAAMIYLVIRK